MKWNEEALRKEALKYDTRGEFKKLNCSAYVTARKRSLLDSICVHMRPCKETWSHEKVKQEALKYKTYAEFKSKASGAKKYAERYGIYKSVTSHMVHNNKWDKKRVIKEAKKYTSRSSIPNDLRAAAKRYGVSLEDFPYIKEKTRWTKDNLIIEASKYTTIKEFRDNSASAYTTACRSPHKGEIFKNLKRAINKNNTWSKSKIIKCIGKCDTLEEFRKEYAVAYGVINKKGWGIELLSGLCRSNKGFKPAEPATLYYLKIDGGTGYKIGITNRTVRERYSLGEWDRIEVLMEREYEFGADAMASEKAILQEFKCSKYEGDPLLLTGNTEVFNIDVLMLDH